MGIIKLTITFALMLLAFFAGFYFNGKITGGVVNAQDEQILNTTHFTKAVCNYENNSCVDVKVSCLGNKVESIELASDLEEFPDDWEDPRTLEERERLCE